MHGAQYSEAGSFSHSSHSLAPVNALAADEGPRALARGERDFGVEGDNRLVLMDSSRPPEVDRRSSERSALDVSCSRSREFDRGTTGWGFGFIRRRNFSNASFLRRVNRVPTVSDWQSGHYGVSGVQQYKPVQAHLVRSTRLACYRIQALGMHAMAAVQQIRRKRRDQTRFFPTIQATVSR